MGGWKHARYLCVCDIRTWENLLDVFLLEPLFRCSLFVLWGFHVTGFRWFSFFRCDRFDRFSPLFQRYLSHGEAGGNTNVPMLAWYINVDLIYQCWFCSGDTLVVVITMSCLLGSIQALDLGSLTEIFAKDDLRVTS